MSTDLPSSDIILSVRAISKGFPGVRALDSVDLALRKGEVHAICGENGAGKSTLMKILAGLYQPDAGTLSYKGREVSLADPLAAKEAGILLVHQELSLVDDLSVAENIYLGNYPTKAFGKIDYRKLQRDTQAALDRLGCDFTAQERVGMLSIARKQLVEIARVLAFNASVVIFDEPTASLTQQEADHLFGVIRWLAANGAAVVYISHKMKEIFEVSDYITVLRDGRISGALETRRSNEDDVSALMIGRALDQYFVRARPSEGHEVLRAEGLTASGIKDISFTIRSGEVLGLYGLVGSGRTEIAETLFGIRPLKSGTIFWEGKERRIASPEDAITTGMGFVPEDRKQTGLVLGLGANANLSLATLSEISFAGILSQRKERRLFEAYRQKLRIAVSRPAQPAATLSGGNQQKIVIAKWLAASPKLLILDEPTRGVDVGAKAEIHKLIANLAEQGLAVLVISSEMPEIMGIAHRIMTIANGRIGATFRQDAFSEEAIFAAATANTH